MRTNLRRSITAEDVAKLKDIHRQLCELMRGLHASSPAHAPLYAAIATVNACAVDWSGDPMVIVAPGPAGWRATAED